jgi:uncharacterized protein with GYD domain
MAHYLLQLSYTPQAWANLTKSPQNRIEAVRPSIEKLGGKIESAYFAFGDYDLVVLLDMPDNIGAAAISLAFNSGGAVSSIKTTVLMTIEEGIEAMKKAGGTGYKPPAG